MRQKVIFHLCIFIGMLAACGTPEGLGDGTAALEFDITNLSDEAYPDNPDIGFRASRYQNDFFATGLVQPTSRPFELDFRFFTKTNDTIGLSGLDVSEFIPTIPERVKGDAYLSYIALVNQEWNRNQVVFDKSEFQSSLATIARVDLARNCLNAYLWEVILYTAEGGDTLPFAHGWFDFPAGLYADLFAQKNGVSFDVYRAPLEEWVNPPSEKVNLAVLRTTTDTLPIAFTDASYGMYPMKGAREKKRKEIIYPQTFTAMRDLQSDSTLFATFSPPGIYTKQDPRKTELGRIYTLKDVQVFASSAADQSEPLHEIAFTFQHRTSGIETTLLLGGLDFEAFPVLAEGNANMAWKNSMGVGNHPFYETYSAHTRHKAGSSPYFAMLLDTQGRWLDSHAVGIDGPLIHFSDKERTLLHVWLLSFERHALVGHYLIDLAPEI